LKKIQPSLPANFDISFIKKISGLPRLPGSSRRTLAICFIRLNCYVLIVAFASSSQNNVPSQVPLVSFRFPLCSGFPYLRSGEMRMSLYSAAQQCYSAAVVSQDFCEDILTTLVCANFELKKNRPFSPCSLVIPACITSTWF
jgi:hypothetical protein